MPLEANARESIDRLLQAAGWHVCDAAAANIHAARGYPRVSPRRTTPHRAEVDRRLSLIRETEAQVDANLRRTERLRQSVLAKAFKPNNSDHVTRAIG